MVLRHAKSDWTEPSADRQRPLARRGVRAAGHMGRFVAAIGAPELAFVSPARRTVETFRLAAEAGDWSTAPIEVDLLYGASAGEVLEGLRGRSSVVWPRAAVSESVMIVGHEPTCSDLIAELTGAVVRFPTAALAVIDSDAGWDDVGLGWGALRSLTLPRDLGSILD